MQRSAAVRFATVLAAGVALLAGCAAPRFLWPQSDIPLVESVLPLGGKVVLVASRDSQFKRALVGKLQSALAAEGIGTKVVGLRDLGPVSPFDYGAVVLINTCMAWGLDREVQAFVDRYEGATNIVVVTTSAQGDWTPRKRRSDFDAVSSASRMADVDVVAKDTVDRVRARLGPHSQPSARVPAPPR